MKRTRKLILALVVVMSLLMAMAVAIIPASAATTRIIYLKPSSNWREAGAWFQAWTWGGSSADAWVTFTDSNNDGIYEATIPSDRTGMKILRKSPDHAANSWTSWAETGDISIKSDKNCLSNSDWGTTFTWSTYTPPVEEPEVNMVTTYFINSTKWTTVNAYYWMDGGASISWPGVAMTKTGDTVHGFDVYSIEVDSNAYNRIIFNNGSGSQTADLELKADKYYYLGDTTWYDDLASVPNPDPLATDCFIAGEFNGWSTVNNQFKLRVEGETIGYVTLELEANKTYEFKVVKSGTWLGNGGTMTYDNCTDWGLKDADNCILKTACAGEYTFAFNIETNKISVTYPDHKAGAAADCENAQTCTVCGTELAPALGHGHEACPHTALIGNKGYATIQEAIADAEAGSEIILNSNLTVDGELLIENGVIINLNGKELTAGKVVTFYEETKFIGDGKLVVAKDDFHSIKVETYYLPVWNEAGYYTFNKVKDQVKKSTVEDTEVVVFRPAFENAEIKNELADGASDNGLAFVVSITWGTGDNKVCKEYTLSEELIANVYNAEAPKAIQLGFENWQADVEYTVTLKIACGNAYYETILCIMTNGSISIPEAQ